MKKIHLEISNQVPRGIADMKVKIAFDNKAEMILAIQTCMELSPEFKAIIEMAVESYEVTKIMRDSTPIIIQDFTNKFHQ